MTNNPEEQSVENEIFYFGGPLFGINNPTLPCNSEVLTNSDGTRVAFCVDPRPLATRDPVGPVERGPVARESEDLFSTPDLGDDFGDAENFFENAQTVFQYAENGLNEDLELSSVSISSLHHNNHDSTPPLTYTRSQKIATWPTWRKIETSSYWQMRPWVPIRKRGRSQLTQHQLTTRRTMMSSRLKYQPDSTPSTPEQELVSSLKYQASESPPPSTHRQQLVAPFQPGSQQPTRQQQLVSSLPLTPTHYLTASQPPQDHLSQRRTSHEDTNPAPPASTQQPARVCLPPCAG